MPPTIVTIVSKREDSNDSASEDQYSYYRGEKKLREQLEILFSVELMLCLLIFIPSFVLYPSIWMKTFCSMSLLIVAVHYVLICELHPESVVWYNIASFILTTCRCITYICSIVNYMYVMIYSRSFNNQETLFENIYEYINAFAFNIAEIICIILSIVIFMKEVKLVNLYKRFIHFMEDFKVENVVETYNITDNLLIIS